MLDRRIAGLSRRGLALALGCLALSGSPAPSWAACTKVQPGWLWNYEGHLAGQHRIRMTLVFGAGEVTGVYFYASQLKDIVLRGRMLDATRLELEELDPAGRPAARFEVEFPEQAPQSKFGTSPLQCEVIRGFWRKVGADTSLPVLLEMEGGTSGSVKSRYAAIGVRDPETVHRPAQAFWHAVKSDDRKTAARLIRYPIRVSTAAGPRRYTSAEQLLADYELIFTPRFRELIAQGCRATCSCATRAPCWVTGRCGSAPTARSSRCTTRTRAQRQLRLYQRRRPPATTRRHWRPCARACRRT